MSKIDYVFLDGGHDYETVKNETPANVSPAYDGMVINFQNW